MSTLEPIKSMERVVNLHVALVQIRNSAFARYRSALSDLGALNCAQGSATSDFDTCLVIDDHKLLALLHEEPYIPLVFCTDLTQGARIQTLWTPSLKSAMHWRMLTRQVQSCEGDVKALRQKISAKAKDERIERMRKNTVKRRKNTMERRGKWRSIVFGGLTTGQTKNKQRSS